MSVVYTSVVIRSERSSRRLEYVCNWIFAERLGIPYSIHTADTAPSDSSVLVLDYGVSAVPSIPNAGLLFASEQIHSQINWGYWDALPVCFFTGGSASIPFDLFSAVFYLLSRMEEYLDARPDKHGRFDARNSCLYREGLTERPIVDEWVHAFRIWLSEQGLTLPERHFQYLPTYDIDIAWSYLYKGIVRNAGGFLKDILAGRWNMLGDRVRVLSGSKPDPYDSFSTLDRLHTHKQLHPLYFILSARNTSPYDKNISPSHPAMMRLIGELADRYEIGLHPSYESSRNPSLLEEELRMLRQTSGRDITRSRQHYIRFSLPDTFQQLAAAGMQHDYSMGYGAQLGFRAGTGASFLWYDLRREEVSTLRTHPFCFMDTTAHYEIGLSPEAAFDRLRSMQELLVETGSTLVTIFHNFSLGSDPEWAGWREQYEQFIKES